MSTWLVLGTFAVLVWFLRKVQWSAPSAEQVKPSVAARDRLGRELAQLQADLKRLREDQTKQAPKVRRTIQLAWIEEALAKVPIESVEADGIGPKVFQSLRAAGIQSVADLGTGALGVVQGIGGARTQALERVHLETWRALEAESDKLSDGVLDRWSNGQLSDAKWREQTQSLARAREIAAFEARIADLRLRAEAAGLPELDEAIRKQQPARPADLQRPARQPRAAPRNQAMLVCPRCGSALRLRSGRYGAFYGCVAYPKCRYTRPS